MTKTSPRRRSRVWPHWAGSALAGENGANYLPRTFVLLGVSSSALRPIFDSEGTIRTMRAIALWINLSPILGGWAVCLSDGREVARFRGPGARGRAERFAHGF